MTVNEYKETACATPEDVDADTDVVQNAPQDSENLLGRVLAGETQLPPPLISHRGAVAVFTFVYLGQCAAP